MVEAAAQVDAAPAATARWLQARRRRPRTSVAHRSARPPPPRATAGKPRVG